MMRTRILAAAAVAAAIGSAEPVGALATRCMYNGQVYGEGVVICQAGLTAMCMNGEWQTKSSFCSGTPDGSVLGGGGGGGGAVEIIEVPVQQPPPQE